MLASVREDDVRRQLMTLPGVGPVTALTFCSAVDGPARFSRPRAVERGGEAEDVEEWRGGLLVAGGVPAPFFEPCAGPLHPIAVVVNPRKAGEWRLVPLRWNGGREPRLQMCSNKAWLV